MIARVTLLAIAALWAVFSCPAQARDPDGRYANSPHRDWYQTRKLTPAAQKRLFFGSCCAHSDVVKTKFRPTADGDDGWEFVNGKGQWERVPNDIIWWGEDTPTGEPVMFAISGVPVCFFPGSGGI
jgi:hypothetical protein